MKKVVMYSKKVCPYCVSAKNLLQNNGIPFEEILIDGCAEFYQELKERTGHMTVPQIFFGETFIGGYDELKDLENNGSLTQLLK